MDPGPLIRLAINDNGNRRCRKQHAPGRQLMAVLNCMGCRLPESNVLDEIDVRRGRELL